MESDYEGTIRAHDDGGGKLAWSRGPDDAPRVEGDPLMRTKVEEALRSEDVIRWLPPGFARIIESPHAFSLAADEVGYRVTEDPLLTWFDQVESVENDEDVILGDGSVFRGPSIFDQTT